MLIEFHMLKNYPPVNLNRDDNGMPKTCFFGGVQRGRISSQCLKRSWRTSEVFRNLDSYGIRTRKMPELVANKLLELGVSTEYIAIAKKKLANIATKKDKTNEDATTAQAIFFSMQEIDRIALHIKEIIEKADSLDDFKGHELKGSYVLKEKPITADIALFGRMVTSEFFVDVDASMQVAHAISTHMVNRESDYFTAVGDLLDNNGKKVIDMIGDIDYNSCCYYEYASLDTDILRANLENIEDCDDLIERLIPALLKAMAFSNPSGKQNTFAGQILPDLVMVEFKKDKIPLSYINAFEEPVHTWGNNPRIVYNSVRALFDHVSKMDAAYSLPVAHRGYFAPRFNELSLDKGDCFASFDEMVNNCIAWMNEVDGK